jgi:ankyrin repeat protein
MADQHDDDGNPIVEAMRNLEPLEVIESIIDANPEMLRRRNRAGYLPIHWAIWTFFVPPSVVRLLLHAWPESAQQATDDAHRSLPAHLACLHAHYASSSASEALDAVQAVVRAHPDALGTADAEGRLPLHAACHSHGQHFKVVAYLVREHPPAVRVRDDDGRLPLHHAVRHGSHRDTTASSLPAVKHLVKAWPQSVREKTKFGALPLLLAVEMDVPVDVAEFLVEAWPGSVREKTSRTGEIPLHAAAAAGSLPLVTFLVSRWSDSVRQAADSGRLPLHEAAAVGNVSVLRFLAGKWRQSVQAKSKDGSLPVHDAARAGKVDAIRYLVAEWPHSVQEKTGGGWLPVHAALRCRPWDDRGLELALDVAQFLVGQHPTSVSAATNDGCLPIHLAAGYALFVCGRREEGDNDAAWRRAVADMELRLVRFLVAQAPMSLRIMSRDGNLPVVVVVVTCIGGCAACLEDINPRQWGRTPPCSVAKPYLLVYATLYPFPPVPPPGRAG